MLQAVSATPIFSRSSLVPRTPRRQAKQGGLCSLIPPVSLCAAEVGLALSLLLTQVHWGRALSRPEASHPTVLWAPGQMGTNGTLSPHSCHQHRSGEGQSVEIQKAEAGRGSCREGQRVWGPNMQGHMSQPEDSGLCHKGSPVFVGLPQKQTQR